MTTLLLFVAGQADLVVGSAPSRARRPGRAPRGGRAVPRA
jgi:hypothetical protein